MSKQGQAVAFVIKKKQDYKKVKIKCFHKSLSRYTNNNIYRSSSVIIITGLLVLKNIYRIHFRVGYMKL